MSIIRACEGALLVLVVVACDPINTIHVEPGSTAGALHLHPYRMPDSVSGIATIDAIEVDRCGGRWLGASVWKIERTRHRWFGAREDPIITYGRLPSNQWRTSQQATPLDTGCYLAVASGGAIPGSAAFRVASDGEIHEISHSALQELRNVARLQDSSAGIK
jgi:hypothetical protein